MSYNKNIPKADDRKKDSQPEILENFKTISSLLEVDHNITGWTDPIGTDGGKHNKVTLPVQATAPTLTSTDNGFYNLIPTTGALTAIQEVFIHKQSNAGVKEIPFTASILSTSSPAILTSGWTYLPSGILLKWGQETANGLQTITLPTSSSIPVYTKLITAIVCIAEGSSGDVDKAIRLQGVPSSGSFKVFGSFRTKTGAANAFFTYLTIGY